MPINFKDIQEAKIQPELATAIINHNVRGKLDFDLKVYVSRGFKIDVLKKDFPGARISNSYNLPELINIASKGKEQVFVDPTSKDVKLNNKKVGNLKQIRTVGDFMRKLNISSLKGVFEDVKEDMSRYYADPKLGLGKPKTWNPKTQKFEELQKEDAPVNSAGGGAVAGIGVGPDGEPGVKVKKKREDEIESMMKHMIKADARTKTFKEKIVKLEKARTLRAARNSRLKETVLNKMDEFSREENMVENNIKIIKDIVKRKQNKNIRFKDGSMKVDLFTASAVAQVYDKVNSTNRAKIDKMINGRKADFLKISNAIFGMLNKKR
jgi:hypothetical protein